MCGVVSDMIPVTGMAVIGVESSLGLPMVYVR